MPATDKQEKLANLHEAIERWNKKLFRAANELQKLHVQRKRLLGPKRPTKIKYRSLEDIKMACGGYEFNDEIPG
jgi:AAA+ ATPase superfamily predicted ATPase